MKTLVKITLTLFPLLIQSGCGKSTNSEQIVSGDTIKTESEMKPALLPESELELSPEIQLAPTKFIAGDFIFTTKRKTEIEIGDRGELLNLPAYKEGLNKRKIIVSNSNNNLLQDASLKCVDLTDPLMKVEHNVVFSSNRKLAEMNVELGNSSNMLHTFNCSVYENNILINESQVELKFYSDIHVNGGRSYNNYGLVANSLNQVGAIFLDETSILSSEGTNLQINAEEIISIGGSRITSFISKDQSGRSGGYINIKAGFIAGEINVDMHGQDGVNVTIVPEAITTYPKHYIPGMLDGVPEQIIRELVCTPGREEDDPEYCLMENVVSMWPTSGKNGLPGMKGEKGYKGNPGGSTGIFRLTVKKSDNFKIEIALRPGKGGKSGEGGAGGMGTPGGNIHCNLYCKGISAGSPGPRGVQGDKGEEGEKGAIGNAEFIDLTVGSENRFFLNEESRQ